MPDRITSASDASTVQLLIRMLKFLRPVRRIAWIAGLVIVARAGIEVLSVYFLSPAVTTVATELNKGFSGESFGAWLFGSSESGTRMRDILLVMGATQVGLGVMIYLRAVWDTKLSMHAVFHMRAAVYDRLQRVDLAYHNRMSSGQIINRAINDLQAVRQFVNMSVLSSLDIICSLAFYLGLLFFRSPLLMLAALLPVPIWSILIFRFSKKAQPICQEQQEAGDKMMGALSENLSGVHVVRAFATEKQEVEKYRKLNDKLLFHLLRSTRLQAALTPSLKVVATGAHVALFVFSAWLIKKGEMHIGDLMLLGAAMSAILAKLQQINSIVEAYQKAIVSSRRLFEIMDLPDAIGPLAERPQETLENGDIEFHRVTFNYGSRAALAEVSCRIPGGKVTALVGPTGSGKSTLAGLIARFYDPDHGAITIDGQDLREINLRDLRHRIGYVFQETFLFSSTIRDNIRYGRMDVSDDMVKRAARIAHADEFIEKLPMGYDTPIGERGVMLSGGQRQRLALARALVYDPEILILDDATAALDATTEQVIHERLDLAFRGRTVLMIANRLASVENADHVLVLEHGNITQSGTHEELLKCEGHYRDIIRMQMMSDGATADFAKSEPGFEPTPIEKGIA